jgi:hypothetical protein
MIAQILKAGGCSRVHGNDPRFEINLKNLPSRMNDADASVRQFNVDLDLTRSESPPRQLLEELAQK